MTAEGVTTTRCYDTGVPVGQTCGNRWQCAGIDKQRSAAPVEEFATGPMTRVRADEGSGGGGRSFALTRFNHERLAVCQQRNHCRVSACDSFERGKKSELTQRLRVLTNLERVEFLCQICLHFGHLDEGVRGLEALKLADHSGHFLATGRKPLSARVECSTGSR